MKTKLLVIVHQFHNRAGVEEHVRTLSAALADRYQIFLTFPEKGSIWLRSPEGALTQYPGEPISLLAPERSAVVADSLRQVIEAVSPALIHLMHFVYWPLSVIDQVTSTGLPVVCSFHDYYALTPVWTLQGESDPERVLSPEYAESCFGKREISGYLRQRRELIRRSLAKIKHLVVPSVYLLNCLQPVFPGDYRIIPYGINPFSPQSRPKAPGGLRFGYFGALIPQKGWESLVQAFAQARTKHPEIELHIFGGTANPPVPVEQLFFHGPFGPTDLPRIIPSVDVAVIPSTFAETYCIVLSEVWQGGRIAAVSDIGALGERVEDLKTGRKFVPGDVDDIARVLCWFVEHKEWVDWPIPTPVYAAEMANRFYSLYQSAIGSAG